MVCVATSSCCVTSVDVAVSIDGLTAVGSATITVARAGAGAGVEAGAETEISGCEALSSLAFSVWLSVETLSSLACKVWLSADAVSSLICV